MNAAAPAIEARGGGKIVNFASTMGMMGVADNATYCATKAGVVNMTKALACELAPKKINVNAIAPGFTATPMNAHTRADPKAVEFYAELTPGRPYAQPEEIARMALFLASDDGLPMHGSTVLMDEGIGAGI